jgi:hypothetical protein
VRDVYLIYTDDLHDLLIENHDHTEFLKREDVWDFLASFSDFLKKYIQLRFTSEFQIEQSEMPFPYSIWRENTDNLIIELFNSFVQGNFISITAMTRNLLENYVYLKILLQVGDENLWLEWLVCSTLKHPYMKNSKYEDEILFRNKIFNSTETFLATKNLDFAELYERYTLKNSNENSWLARIIANPNGKRITFQDICNYLKDDDLYNDFSELSKFVHGQDFISKLYPFQFFERIFHKMLIMFEYIIKTIEMFTLTEDLYYHLDCLWEELYILHESLGLDEVD